MESCNQVEEGIHAKKREYISFFQRRERRSKRVCSKKGYI